MKYITNQEAKLLQSVVTLGKFVGTSYQDRYCILCETLVLERDFSATALLMSRRPETKRSVAFAEPLPELSVLSFCRSFFAHLVAASHV